eukprot:jgi/Orpsp1_1/1175345/evm.model.c7180000053465.1
MNNSIENNTPDDSTSYNNNNNIEGTSNTTNELNSSVNSIPHIINETIEEEKNEKFVKEKGPGIAKKRVITEPGLKVSLNANKNVSIGASSQSSFSTSALPTDIIDEYDSDTSEFPADFKQTTDMLIQLKERILDSSKKMLSPSVESSNKSLNRKPSSIYSEGSSGNNLSSSYSGKPYVPTIRYTTSFPNKSYTDLNNSNSNLNSSYSNLNNSYTYHNNVSQESIGSSYFTGNFNANNDSLSKYRKIFEYTEDEIKLFNAIEEYALLPKGRLNPGLDDSYGESDEINKLKDEQVLLYKKLNSTRTVLHKEMLAHVNCINEKEELEKKVQELQSLLEEKDKKIEELSVELKSEKGSADTLRKEKQTVQDEVEELTKSLFEEANKLVADEARKRHKVEKINKIISGKLKDSQLQLETQNQQLSELRKKMEEINFENITNKKMMEENKRMSMLSSISDEEQLVYDVNSIDTFLLAEFKDFISSAFNVRMSKLHSIPYMKNCLEDDIMPCLRFGSDPKISWKRLTEEIASNSLLLQEISPNSKSSSPLINRPERSSSISVGNLSNASNSSNNQNSTQNNRSSMWARFSVQAGFGSGIIYDQVFNGCQACGRPNTHSNPIRFQFRIEKYNKNDENDWSPLCSVCRDRIVACCEFYNFIRHIRQGLYTNRGIAELYYENIRLKRQMFYARVGALNQADFDYGFGKLPKLTQSTTTYKRSLSISQIKSEYGGSNSSIIGSIQSPITHNNPVLSVPLNIGSSNDSSNSSVTQVSDQVNPNHRVLNLDTYKPPTSKRNSYLPSTTSSPEFNISDNDDHSSSVVTEDINSEIN